MAFAHRCGRGVGSDTHIISSRTSLQNIIILSDLYIFISEAHRLQPRSGPASRGSGFARVIFNTHTFINSSARIYRVIFVHTYTGTYAKLGAHPERRRVAKRLHRKRRGSHKWRMLHDERDWHTNDSSRRCQSHRELQRRRSCWLGRLLCCLARLVLLVLLVRRGDGLASLLQSLLMASASD